MKCCFSPREEGHWHEDGKVEGSQDHNAAGYTQDDSVFHGKYGQLIEASNEVPARGDVASDEDAEGQGRERVHRALLRSVGHAAG